MARHRRASRLAAFAGVLALATLGAVGCGGGAPGPWTDHPGPKVVVSFAPLYSFVASVAGDDAVVKSVMTTTGPHDFNPTDTDARLIRRADLFFINGLALDNGVAEALQRSGGNRKLKLIPLAERIPEDRLLKGQCHHDHAHDHDDGLDPHAWLSPEMAATMVEAVRDELKAADPAHAEGYDRRAADYLGRLRSLHAEGKALLGKKADRKLVTFHESLSYFAKSFDLTIEGVVQKKPGVEPNIDELRQLIATCKEKKVRLIAVEPQYTSNTSAEGVLRALRQKDAVPDAALVQIDPLETAEAGALSADWYERKMRANLAALAEAMK